MVLLEWYSREENIFRNARNNLQKNEIVFTYYGSILKIIVDICTLLPHKKQRRKENVAFLPLTGIHVYGTKMCNSQQTKLISRQISISAHSIVNTLVRTDYLLYHAFIDVKDK